MDSLCSGDEREERSADERRAGRAGFGWRDGGWLKGAVVEGEEVVDEGDGGVRRRGVGGGVGVLDAEGSEVGEGAWIAGVDEVIVAGLAVEVAVAGIDRQEDEVGSAGGGQKGKAVGGFQVVDEVAVAEGVGERIGGAGRVGSPLGGVDGVGRGDGLWVDGLGGDVLLGVKGWEG